MRLIIALVPEAKPLIDLYNLKRLDGDLMFPIYQNGNLFLVISGIGQLNSSAATAYLHAKSGELQNQPFLNIGIAGHPHLMLGTAIIANRITDGSIGKNWYPPQTVFDSLNRTTLITVKTVEQKYETDAAYDMEAYGYYSSALKSTSSELAQSLKVISDNLNNSSRALNSKRIENLIRDRLDEIDGFVKALQRLSESITNHQTEPYDLESFFVRWHFTVTQRHQLRKLIRRWMLLAKDENPITTIPRDCLNASQAIEALETSLLARPLNLHTTGD
jgi:hypothetical protein